MIIHGKELEEHDFGRIIYYDNILIKSVNQKLNELTTFEGWANYIKNNPGFCGCQYHEFLKRHCKL